MLNSFKIYCIAISNNIQKNIYLLYFKQMVNYEFTKFEFKIVIIFSRTYMSRYKKSYILVGRQRISLHLEATQGE